MRVTDWILAIGGLSGIAVGQYVPNSVPEVDQCVSSTLKHYVSSVHNTRPPPSSQHPTTTATTSTSPTATASCSYWLENVKHQGISAFNPDSNYTVFRNVKDYGAKGEPNSLLCSSIAIPVSLNVVNQQ